MQLKNLNLLLFISKFQSFMENSKTFLTCLLKNNFNENGCEGMDKTFCRIEIYSMKCVSNIFH